tara:strand:+ start:21 stop:743 length:723 start_codon:yes stop_codon:yes gene_type:complete
MTRARDLSNFIGSGSFSSTTFTATAGQTVFTIAHTQGFVQVFMNGLLLDLTVDYTSNGSAITLTSAAVAGDEIEVVKYDAFSVGDAVPASGGTFTGNVNIPGHVVQVVTNTTTAQASKTGQGITDTGLSVNITPTSNTSKVYVMTSFNGGTDNEGAGGVFYLYRDSTKLMTQGSAYSSSGGATYGGHALMILDSPATTSQITYKLRFENQSAGSYTARFNTDYSNVTGELATITVMEIAQ